MQIQQINVEGFGTLSRCRLGLSETGLTVVYGVNGAGKTTLLEFIRGVLCGFDHARQLRLLPPLKEGTPGGAMTVRTERGRFDVIRHARADGSDTLAITLQQGTPDDVTRLRQSLKTMPEKAIRTLFMVGGYDAHSLSAMVKLAIEQGIELVSRRASAAWMTERIRGVAQERNTLFQTIPPQGELAALELRRQRLQASLDSARLAQQQRMAGWQHSLQNLEVRLERLRTESAWLVQELHAVESDLTETQTRLWSTCETVIQEVETVARTVAVAAPEWTVQIAEIDQEIAHAQQVLRDLAGSRHALSLTKAGLAGSETPEPEVTFARQRSALSEMESQTTKLEALAERLKHTSQCICGPQSVAIESTVQSLREQIWLICQELGRQQSVHQQWLVQSQREGVDRCELELTRQIQRLRLRREELLQRHATTPVSRIAHRTQHETLGCICDGHEQAIADHETVGHVVSTPQVIVRARTVTTSAALPGDEAQERILQERRQQLRQQWLEAKNRVRVCEDELQNLQRGGPEMADDRSVQTLRNDLELVEVQLSRGCEQWQQLALVEAVLQRTQQRLNVEIASPVIDHASALLSQMTSGRYVCFRYSTELQELRVMNSAGAELSAQALSRGTLEQAALCFRLACVSEFARQGISLPLVLDDVLADSDENRSRAAVEVLVDFARQHQIVFLTCQEHLLDLFATHQILIADMPGSLRPQRSVVSAAPLELVLPTVATENEDAPQPEVTHDWDRVQPDEPYWLQPNSPLGYVPSLGSQMSRRLGTIGVRDVGELIDLDPEVLEIPLDSLQISASTLRQWQAEARLLCCVPNLTGRDAQALVACGIMAPVELAQCEVRELHNRLRRLRADEHFSLALPWLSERPEWPTLEQTSGWVRSGRAARGWRKIRDDASKSRRTHRQHSKHRERPAPHRSMTKTPQVRLHDEEASQGDRKWRFYLQPHSPIVDAPSIGPKTAERLNAIGVQLVSELLERDADEIATLLGRKEITPAVVAGWQQQSALMCRVPQLRGHDAQVLVSCQIIEPETLAAMSPYELYVLVEPFVCSKEGQRLLRNASVPDLAEVTEWIEYARQSPLLRAA
ncbi:DUF4332 domain-containing protein [Planctomicrobium piriforme]|uniref:AAA domain-containing protein n=1 Tax=Planctomicrobium piriforme TaxID=1576369 RepID=A0A1I3C5V8_9PLAN|nr:DUF4332 domain-containing protein [Planctomicrobium piriforme]SFH69880.1 AAA domain-containing protein [Planctomicrobium piriforme]